MKKLTFYDAFAGIGGIRLGMEQADFACIGGCEVDDGARKVYARNFGSPPSDTDIRSVTALPKGTDVLCGGFPCQSFSQIGARRGFADDGKGKLFFE